MAPERDEASRENDRENDDGTLENVGFGDEEWGEEEDEDNEGWENDDWDKSEDDVQA